MGHYETEDEAARAVDAFVVKNALPNALNFPDEAEDDDDDDNNDDDDDAEEGGDLEVDEQDEPCILLRASASDRASSRAAIVRVGTRVLAPWGEVATDFSTDADEAERNTWSMYPAVVITINDKARTVSVRYDDDASELHGIAACWISCMEEASDDARGSASAGTICFCSFFAFNFDL